MIKFSVVRWRWHFDCSSQPLSSSPASSVLLSSVRPKGTACLPANEKMPNAPVSFLCWFCLVDWMILCSKWELTCHCSSCWLNSTFCCTASISWLFAWRTSILTLASWSSNSPFLVIAASLASLASLTISSWLPSALWRSDLAISFSSRAVFNSVSFTVSYRIKRS